jgi:hypothetical protein
MKGFVGKEESREFNKKYKKTQGTVLFSTIPATYGYRRKDSDWEDAREAQRTL